MKRSNSIALAMTLFVTLWLLPDCANLACASDWSYSHALPGDWNNYIGPVVADLDISANNTDGGKAVITWEANYIRIRKADGTQYANIAPLLVQGQNFNYVFTAAPAVGEIDYGVQGGDDDPEIVAVMEKNDNGHWYSALSAWNFDGGTYLETEQHLNDQNYIFSSVTLYDINTGFMEDEPAGIDEILVTKIDRDDYALEEVLFFKYWYWGGYAECLNSQKGMSGTSTPLPWSGAAPYTSPCVGDMDRDGQTEIIMHTESEIRGCEITGWTITGAQTSALFPTYDYVLTIEDFLGSGANGKFSPMGSAMADVDDDTYLELVITVEDEDDNLSRLFFVERDGTISSSYSLNGIDGIRHNSPAISDLDDDGNLQISFGGMHLVTGQLYYTILLAEYATGSWRSYNSSYWPKDMSSPGLVYNNHGSHPAFANVNGAGDFDLLASYTTASNGYTKVWDVDTGSELNLYLSNEEDNSRAAVCITDLDIDGDMEVVYASRDNSPTPDELKIYVKDLAADYRPDYVEWSQFKNGPRHTGLYAQTVAGTISSDAFWSDHIVVVNDITVSADAVLYIAPGTVIEFEHNKKITVNGSLVCDSWTGSDSIVMKPNNSSETWYGIIIDHDNSSPDVPTAIKNCIVIDAAYGIKVDDINATGDLTIDDCSIFGGTYGLYLQDTPAISVSDVEISDCSDLGILLWNSDARLSDVDVTNSGCGLYMKGASSPDYVEYCDLTENEGYGVYATGASNGIFYLNVGWGHNWILNNGGDGVMCDGESYPNFGYYFSYQGRNKIYGNHDASDYEIANLNSSGTIYAQYNYWGDGGPQASWFEPIVDYSHALTGWEEDNLVRPGEKSSGGTGREFDSEDPIIDFYNAVSNQQWSGAEVILENLLSVAITPAQERQVVSLMGSLFRWSGNLGYGCSVLEGLVPALEADDFATLSLLELLSRSGDKSGALALADTLLDQPNTGPDIKACALLDKGALLKYDLGDPGAGNAAFQEFLNLYPDNPQAFLAINELSMGLSGTSGREVTKLAGLAPSDFKFCSPHPNPFNPITRFAFDLPEAGPIELAVYDLSGRLVSTLIDGWRDAGAHEATFDASHLASGIYVYRLTAGSFDATGKMVLMK